MLVYTAERFFSISEMSLGKALNQPRYDDLASESKLIQLAKNGDLDSQEALIKMHGGLIRSTARKYLRFGYPYEDVLQLCMVAFLKAVLMFEPDRGVKLASYAVFHLKNVAVILEKQYFSVLRIPTYVRTKVNKELQTGTASEKNLQLKKMMKGYAISFQQDLSMQEEDEGRTFAEILGVDAEAEERLIIEQERLLLRQCLQELTEQEREIIRQRFDFDLETDKKEKTFREIAEAMGISPQAVHMRYQRILDKIRASYMQTSKAG